MIGEEFIHPKSPNPNRHVVKAVMGGGNFRENRNSASEGGSLRAREGKIVSHQEYLHLREKGLCFRCGES